MRPRVMPAARAAASGAVWAGSASSNRTRLRLTPKKSGGSGAGALARAQGTRTTAHAQASAATAIRSNRRMPRVIDRGAASLRSQRRGRHRARGAARLCAAADRDLLQQIERVLEAVLHAGLDDRVARGPARRLYEKR